MGLAGGLSTNGGAVAGQVDVGSPLDSSVRLYNPRGLRRWRGALSDAGFGLVPIVCVGDSITFGQGSDGVNAANNVPDNTQGWVGQLRTLFAKSHWSFATDPGEGFLFTSDSRVSANTGANAGNWAFSGPLRHSTRLLSGQSISINAPAAGTFYIIQANNSGDSAGTYTKNAGGSTGLATITGTGVSLSTGVACAANDAFVISGPASAQTYITGFLQQSSNTNGVQVHRVGQAGYVSGDALGGQTSGALNLTSGQQTSSIKKLYDWAGGPGLLIVSFGVNDQQFQAGGGTTAQNNVTLSLYQTWLQAIVTQAMSDGWDVLLLGEPPNPNAANVAGGQESDYHNMLQTLALSNDHCAFLDTLNLWSTASLANTAGLQISSSVHPTRKGHGDMARLVFRAITGAVGELSYTA